MEYSMEYLMKAERDIADVTMNIINEKIDGKVNVEARELVKDHRKRIGFIFRKDGDPLCPTLYVDDYEQSVEDIAADLAKRYLELEPVEDSMIPRDFLEPTKEMILNGAKRVLIDPNVAEDSDELIGEDFVGLKIVYRCVISQNASLLIRRQLAEKLNISEQELFEATKNDEYTIYDMDSFMRNMAEKKIPVECVSDARIRTEPMLIVSTKDAIYGASAITSEIVRKTIAKKFGRDMYLLPSSVHEWIAVEPNESVSEDDLLDMVTSINRAEVSASDFLADAVFHLDKNGTMTRVK